MIDVRVHEALLVSVLSHPQDLRCHGRERWDGDVHVVPSGHGEQGGDLSIQAVETCSLQPRAHGRGHTEISLRTEEMGVSPQSPAEMCHLAWRVAFLMLDSLLSGLLVFPLVCFQIETCVHSSPILLYGHSHD